MAGLVWYGNRVMRTDLPLFQQTYTQWHYIPNLNLLQAILD